MTELTKYLQKKLIKCFNKIDSLKNSIISQVGEGQFNSLKALYDSILIEEQNRKDLTKDLIDNASIAEVIELNTNKDIFGNPQAPLFKVSDLEYAYKYKDKAISLADRDLLIKTYGYRFKESKV